MGFILALYDSKYYGIPSCTCRAQIFVQFYSRYSTPRVSWKMPEMTVSVSHNFCAERSFPQPAGNSNILNYIILNPFKMYVRTFRRFAVHPDRFNPPCSINSILPTPQSKTGMPVPTLNTPKILRIRTVIQYHDLSRCEKHTPFLVLLSSSTLLSHSNATVKVTLESLYNTIPTTH